MATLPSQEEKDAQLEDLTDVTFSPPLYVQRYEEITRITKEWQPKKVVDIGCGELKVIRLLKFHAYIHELVGMDIDKEVLRGHRYLIEPLPAHYLKPLPHPLVISLLHGSITKPDSRLLNCDLAVCVEVIEHLYPDDVAEATRVIFGFMQPTKAVFTTPNSEFNVLFPGLQKFRHPDHKFEWTRREFQAWGDRVCDEYGYSVEYSGLGTGPEGSEHLGSCTQIALFSRRLQSPQKTAPPSDKDESLQPYSVVARQIYPYRMPEETTAEDILCETGYRVRQLLEDARWLMDEELGMFDDASQDGEGDVSGRMNWSTPPGCRSSEVRRDAGDAVVNDGACQSQRDVHPVGGSEVGSRNREAAQSGALEEQMQRLRVTCGDSREQEASNSEEGGVEGKGGGGGADDGGFTPSICTSARVQATSAWASAKEDSGGNSVIAELPRDRVRPSAHLYLCSEEMDEVFQHPTDCDDTANTRDSEAISSVLPGMHAAGGCQFDIGGERFQTSCAQRVFEIGIVNGVVDIEAYSSGLHMRADCFRTCEDFPPCCADCRCGFYDHWEKGVPASHRDLLVDNLKVMIPLHRLLKFPILWQKCPDISKLREIIRASESFDLTDDGTAIICDLYEEDRCESLWSLGFDKEDAEDPDDDEDDGHRGDIPIIHNIPEPEECWD
ncbi:uncharacterized protein [Diadema setosum]|uniref:uncharacterized protein n=1 Tax=Diadema setosum TaxID=31175 RepID=UPI003B3B74FD